MRVGNDYAIDIERMKLDKLNGLLITSAPYSKVWKLPEYEETCAPYFRNRFSAPVRVLPHLWSPRALEREAAKLPERRSFDYRPGRRRWRAGIFEPNIGNVKTSFVPLFCCEVAHRASPDIFEHAWAYNTLRLTVPVQAKLWLMSPLVPTNYFYSTWL
jgi:hypothetical protein